MDLFGADLPVEGGLPGKNDSEREAMGGALTGIGGGYS